MKCAVICRRWDSTAGLRGRGLVDLGFACDVCFPWKAQNLKLDCLVLPPIGQRPHKEAATCMLLSVYLQTQAKPLWVIRLRVTFTVVILEVAGSVPGVILGEGYLCFQIILRGGWFCCWCDSGGDCVCSL